MADGFGAITWWGFSPALDLQGRYQSLASKLKGLNISEPDASNKQGKCNILLIGAGDCRHILKTIVHSYRRVKRELCIFVVENNLELYARHLLLLSIALEPKKKLGLQEKTELFLELFGNSLVRPQASDYLQQKSSEFIKMVTDSDYLEAHLPVFNFSQLKFKERDQLESIFKFWRNSDPKIFDICRHWDERLRQYLAVRYDSRENIYDWDYSMKLSKKGVAFELRSDSTYEVTNRTLASGIIIKKDGERVARRGYWGDIINSPYLAFGTESEEESLFQTSNGQHVKTATNVSEYNITAFMHEILTGEKYIAPKIDDEKKGKKEMATLQEIQEEEVESDQVGSTKDEDTPQENVHPTQGYMRCPGTTVTFLPLNCVPDLSKKSKYNKLFDVIYFSNSMVHLLTPDVKEIFSDEAVIITETTKFMLDLKPEQMREYLKKITSMAESAGCKAAGHTDGEEDAHTFFTFQR
ncbi:Dynein assembly factor 3, axonemal [Stylophora pistillata]|uniref:Dynein assembly factor 3, axonemal n=1 Tax=Stylophora pistillata TaxID=50429 RepID=A0A2B4SQC0_STYPI|nr:Dynein assembly factor 3, axonemal [Stylophora pistillata]